MWPRHRHRWTAWSDPTFDTWGESFQIRRCKDRDCNKHQRRDCER